MSLSHLEGELANLATRLESLEERVDRPNGKLRIAGGLDYQTVNVREFKELASIVSDMHTTIQRLWAAIEEIVESD